MSKGWRSPVAKVAVVAVVVAVSATAWSLFEQRAGDDAFLERVYAEMEAVRSVHLTSTGTIEMADGTVIHSTSEGDSSFSDNGRGWASRFLNTYEECAFPRSSYSSLCSDEWVFVNGVLYMRETTDSGPGEWKIQDQLCPVSTEAPLGPIEIIERLKSRGLVESGEESIDGVVYRSFKGTPKPEEQQIERLEAGECKPPPNVSREQMIASLRKSAEETTWTVIIWVGKDDYRIWRISYERASKGVVSTYSHAPVQSVDITEYSHYNEPVVIEPPIY